MPAGDKLPSLEDYRHEGRVYMMCLFFVDMGCTFGKWWSRWVTCDWRSRNSKLEVIFFVFFFPSMYKDKPEYNLLVCAVGTWHAFGHVLVRATPGVFDPSGWVRSVGYSRPIVELILCIAGVLEDQWRAQHRGVGPHFVRQCRARLGGRAPVWPAYEVHERGWGN